MPRRPHLVIIGVSGSGKSSVGAALADALDLPFADADDLHPQSNVDKMAAGTPLTDDDRWPWLDRVGETLAEAPEGLVIACSALRRVYRDRIAQHAPHVQFVLLDWSRELLAERMGARENHFMPTTLLDSQLATLEALEADEAGFAVSIEGTPAAIVAEIENRLAH